MPSFTFQKQVLICKGRQRIREIHFIRARGKHRNFQKMLVILRKHHFSSYRVTSFSSLINVSTFSCTQGQDVRYKQYYIVFYSRSPFSVYNLYLPKTTIHPENYRLQRRSISIECLFILRGSYLTCGLNASALLHFQSMISMRFIEYIKDLEWKWLRAINYDRLPVTCFVESGKVCPFVREN